MQAPNSENDFLSQKTLLTESAIKAAWPNLPSAKELRQLPICFFVDSRDYSAKDFSSIIVNCTTNGINAYTGDIIRNQPQIWLQYDETIWILVPQNYLKQTYSSPNTNSAIQQDMPEPTQTTEKSTWALGFYSNPSTIAGSSPVMGAVSFGEWTTGYSSPDTEDYVLSPCLSVVLKDTEYLLQQMMVTLYNGAKYIGQNVIDMNDPYNPLYNYATPAPYYAATETLYNNYIKHNSTTSGRWDFCWNFETRHHIDTTPAITEIKVGNQPSVVFETTDTVSSHFGSNYQIDIGGNYTALNGTTYYMAAIGYLFNGDWKPQYMNDNYPYAKVYYGHTFPPSPNAGYMIGEAGPVSWMGVRSLYREQVNFGKSITLPSQDTVLWNSG